MFIFQTKGKQFIFSSRFTQCIKQNDSIIRFYFMYATEETIQSTIHELNIIANGHPQSSYTFRYKPPLTEHMIQRSYQSKRNTKLRKMRLFNQEGVQFHSEDLKYLKNKQSLYVSKGQDFDAKSSFSQYQIIKPIGEGGFGKVSLAQHRQTKALAAIKVMKVSSFGNTSEIDLVFRQAQSLQVLQHSNIVEIYKCYTLTDMRVIVVMEYMQGGELHSRLKQKRKFDQVEAKIYFKQIVKAIIHIHSKNIIHRDLKLQNILIKSKDSNKVKIADFGISGSVQHINPKSCSGTLRYMAPEVLAGNLKQYTSAVDIWALGVILFYMLVGKLPFVGGTGTAIIAQITAGKYEIPAGSMSIEAEELISRMLDLNPKTRIKAQEIRDHPWLKTSILEVIQFTMQEHLENIKEFQSRKQLANTQNIQNIKQKPKFSKSAKISVSSHRSSEKTLKQNDSKFPRLNRPINKSKSIIKRGATLQKKSFLEDMRKGC